MFRNLLLLTFGILAAMLGLAYYTTNPDSQNNPPADKVLLLFDKIAFSGFGEAGPTGTGPFLRRWTGPVKIALVGAPPDDGEDSDRVPWGQAVEAMAALYSQVKNLEVSVVAQGPYQAEPKAEGNLQIVTIPAAEMETVMDSLPPKLAGMLGNSRGGCVVLGADAAALNTVTILMAGTLSDSRRAACLGESLATALGFTIPEKYTSDVFNVRQGTLRFHGLGRIAASLVYDPALQPGMPRDQARALAASVLKEKGF
jgi:hypothetical protein